MMRHLKIAAYSLDERPFEENISKYLEDSKSCELQIGPMNPDRDVDEIILEGADIIRQDGFNLFGDGNFDV